jgi:hypothetical protein
MIEFGKQNKCYEEAVKGLGTTCESLTEDELTRVLPICCLSNIT